MFILRLGTGDKIEVNSVTESYRNNNGVDDLILNMEVSDAKHDLTYYVGKLAADKALDPIQIRNDEVTIFKTSVYNTVSDIQRRLLPTGNWQLTITLRKGAVVSVAGDEDDTEEVSE